MTHDEIWRSAALGIPVSDSDAREFVKQCIASTPQDAERKLSVMIERAHYGRPSRVLFALVGSPMRGHATLYPDDGRLEFIPAQPDRFVLQIERSHGGTRPRRMQNVSKIAMFLQVARAKAASEDGTYLAVDHSID